MDTAGGAGNGADRTFERVRKGSGIDVSKLLSIDQVTGQVYNLARDQVPSAHPRTDACTRTRQQGGARGAAPCQKRCRLKTNIGAAGRRPARHRTIACALLLLLFAVQEDLHACGLPLASGLALAHAQLGCRFLQKQLEDNTQVGGFPAR